MLFFFFKGGVLGGEAVEGFIKNTLDVGVALPSRTPRLEVSH
jgi:hypothetical protein